MHRDEIQKRIDDGTFMNLLMQEVVIRPHDVGDGKLTLEIVFPEWYAEHISADSRERIETLIRQNAKRAYDISKAEAVEYNDEDGAAR